MAYMVRLGIWGPGSPFRDFNDFLAAVEKRGVGAMEIVAMDMKLRGMYIARQLSFQVTLSLLPSPPPSQIFSFSCLIKKVNTLLFSFIPLLECCGILYRVFMNQILRSNNVAYFFLESKE
jgi:hypothetical protein